MKLRGNIRSWSNCFKDEPCFIIGNAPSLEHVEDLHLVQQYFTVGINRAFKLFDPTVLFWQDISLYQSEKDGVNKSESIKLCRDTCDPLKRFLHFSLQNNENFRLPASPNILYGRGSSAPLAFQFAYALGCDPIILLGMDCKYKDGKTDFYGVNQFHKAHTLPMCRFGLEWIKSCSSRRSIINCSDNDVFAKKYSIKDSIKMIPLQYLPKGKDYYKERLISLLPK